MLVVEKFRHIAQAVVRFPLEAAQLLLLACISIEVLPVRLHGLWLIDFNHKREPYAFRTQKRREITARIGTLLAISVGLVDDVVCNLECNR